MQFTKAVASDFDAIKQLYWNLIDKSSGEPSFPGWKKGEHPSDEMIATSIDQGQMFLLKELLCIMMVCWQGGFVLIIYVKITFL